MKIIEPSFEILTTKEEIELMIKRVELAARNCYRSEDKITEDSWKRFLQGIVNRGHLSVIEHANITVEIVCDRGIMAEITRHRIGSYSVESSRYCNYSKDKFGSEIKVINPCFWETDKSIEDCRKKMIWIETMAYLEEKYMQLLKLGATPEESRLVLPNSLATKIIMTLNLRAWRNFFELRTEKGSHPQMKEIAIPLLKEFQTQIPIIFDDISPK